MAKRLDGKVAIVTGADSGIGQAISHAFAREGADVLILFHSDAQGAGKTRQLVQAQGCNAAVCQIDVTDQRAVAELFDDKGSPLGQLGAPDILVNAAGVGADATSVAETAGEAWDRVIRTNLNGPFYFSRHFVQARKAEGGGGKVINITSVHEAIPSPNAAAYGASKGGLLTFTRSLALEVARDKITVNAIAPGMIRMPMTAGRANDPEKRRQAESRIPLGRIGEPAEIAELAVYLASPAADYVTGQSFTIDGGLELDWGQGA
ncbi:MAG TPA: glucose 1-dehydrogenase [Rhodopila sp.]|nr:glucose 1-dehydrogenase [Rhodopila sp.]